MKLCVCVVHNRDKAKVTDELIRAGFKFTIIGSTGGFLREGNTTFLIGFEAADEATLLDVINSNCSTREQVVNAAPFDASPAGAFLSTPVKVPVGGAVVFILPVERFERF
ncbi:MAG: cyclic-di-AMP receptor [Chthonomonas sp.]|nr:cyclic-di-AMP receptor [Chthonomonas sp.]